jgi:hypothetical protein
MTADAPASMANSHAMAGARARAVKKNACSGFTTSRPREKPQEGLKQLKCLNNE